MDGSPTRKVELQGIQILRGVAALAVVIHHALEESNAVPGRFSPDWLTTTGAAGVDIFFVISGFIMLHVGFPDRRPLLRPGQFLLRRVTRIYPLYWLTCLGVLLLSSAGLLQRHHWSFTDIVSSLLLIPNGNRLVGVSWTLVYEMYFYLIFAATLMLESWPASIRLSTLCIIGLGIGGAALGDAPIGAFLTEPIALEFCMGLWLAWAITRLPSKWGRHAPIYGVLGLGVFAVGPLLVDHATTGGLPGMSRVVAWGLPGALVVWGFVWVDARGKLGRFAVLMGDASYALYLTHPFVMMAYAWLLKSTVLRDQTQIAIVPIVVGAAILLGLCTHLVIERPLLRLIRAMFPAVRSRSFTSPNAASTETDQGLRRFRRQSPVLH